MDDSIKSIFRKAARFAQEFRSDGWANRVTGIGTSRDKMTAAEVEPVVPLRPETLENLYHGDDIAARIVDALPDHALRQGFRVTHEDPEVVDRYAAAMRDKIRELNVRRHVKRAAIWGRLYGRGAVLLGYEGANQDRPPQPGDRLAFVDDLERRDFSPEPGEIRGGEPEIWRLNPPDHTGWGERIHRDRLVIFGGAMTGDRLRARNEYSDLSVLDRPKDKIRDIDQIWASAAHLVGDASQAVLKIKGFFDQVVSSDTGPIETRLALMDLTRSVARAIVLDADSEDFERKATTFSGIPETLQEAWKRGALAGRMPVTVLMGISPAGLNATGESDTRSWYAEVEAYQTYDLAPAIGQIVNAIARSEGWPEGWEIQFPSLWTMAPPEEASYRGTVTAADVAAVQAGILLPEEVAIHRHSGDPDAWVTPVPVDVDLRRALLEAETAGRDQPAPEPVEEEAAPAPPAPEDGPAAPPEG